MEFYRSPQSGQFYMINVLENQWLSVICMNVCINASESVRNIIFIRLKCSLHVKIHIFSKNMLELRVYYEELNFDSVVQSPGYDAGAMFGMSINTVFS